MNLGVLRSSLQKLVLAATIEMYFVYVVEKSVFNASPSSLCFLALSTSLRTTWVQYRSLLCFTHENPQQNSYLSCALALPRIAEVRCCSVRPSTVRTTFHPSLILRNKITNTTECHAPLVLALYATITALHPWKQVQPRVFNRVK